ncbi:hypothetical protein PIB30_029278 [Stylosanthes scabra]|uniref:DRBM domain-containing protein n=1 Tax=Stylosanthes scabra TaxID=79078 RepID=A0ABU6VBD3_9FABA|nr:hypothetical protein [Stylosanthes scabra]
MNDPEATAAETATCRHVSELIRQARNQGPLPSQPAAVGSRGPHWPYLSPEDFSTLFHRALPQYEDVMEYVPQRDWSTVVQWRSRKIALRSLCMEQHCPGPHYQKHSTQSTSHGLVHRFCVVLPPGDTTPVLTGIGRYSTDEHLAREDAATEMIRSLLATTGTHIDDFNYDQIDETLQRNVELGWEIGYVKSQYKRVHGELRHLKRVVNPDLLGSSDSDDDP